MTLAPALRAGGWAAGAPCGWGACSVRRAAGRRSSQIAQRLAVSVCRIASAAAAGLVRLLVACGRGGGRPRPSGPACPAMWAARQADGGHGELAAGRGGLTHVLGVRRGHGARPRTTRDGHAGLGGEPRGRGRSPAAYGSTTFHNACRTACMWSRKTAGSTSGRRRRAPDSTRATYPWSTQVTGMP